MFFLFSFLSHKQHVNNFIQVVFSVILLFHVLNVQMDWHLLMVNANVFSFLFSHTACDITNCSLCSTTSHLCVECKSGSFLQNGFCQCFIFFFLISSLFFNPKLCSMQWRNNMHNVFIFIKHFSWKWSMSLFVFVFHFDTKLVLPFKTVFHVAKQNDVAQNATNQLF